HIEAERLQRAADLVLQPLLRRGTAAAHHDRAGHGASSVPVLHSFASLYAAAILRCTSCSLAGSTPTSARMCRISPVGWMIVMLLLAFPLGPATRTAHTRRGSRDLHCPSGRSDSSR